MSEFQSLIEEHVHNGIRDFDDLSEQDQIMLSVTYMLTLDAFDSEEIMSESLFGMSKVFALYVIKESEIEFMNQAKNKVAAYCKKPIQEAVDKEVADLPQQRADKHTDDLISEAKVTT